VKKDPAAPGPRVKKEPTDQDLQRLLARGTPEEDNELRPRLLKDYIGQERVTETLAIAIEAARKREEPLDHTLFHGPPGIGKTTLAFIIAREMDTQIVCTSGPSLDRGGDLVSVLTHLKRGDVLFIDEIHRLPAAVEELLYPAMEDFAVDIVFGSGLSARVHRHRLEKFTLVGATTRTGMLSRPLRERFGIFRDLDFYAIEDLCKIATRSAGILSIGIDADAARILAERSRGTPRIVNRLLRRVRDYSQVRGTGRVTTADSEKALELEGVDTAGLTPLDRRYLETILRNYSGGPVGIEALASTLQEDLDTLVDMVEPFLLKAGYVNRTPGGRKATPLALRHLGLEAQSGLFS